MTEAVITVVPPVPEAVRTPDDECQNPKHVELSTDV